MSSNGRYQAMISNDDHHGCPNTRGGYPNLISGQWWWHTWTFYLRRIFALSIGILIKRIRSFCARQLERSTCSWYQHRWNEEKFHSITWYFFQLFVYFSLKLKRKLHICSRISGHSIKEQNAHLYFIRSACE